MTYSTTVQWLVADVALGQVDYMFAYLLCVLICLAYNLGNDKFFNSASNLDLTYVVNLKDRS